jgi:ankyrin repeat protein
MTSTRRTFLIASTGTALSAQEDTTDIFQAIVSGNIALMTQLLDADPQLARSRSADGRTPLHYACATGNLEMVTRIVTRGGELSAPPESPLLAAIDLPDHEAAYRIAEFLIINASNPNARTRDGRTALQIARARKYDDIAELLIHRGAAVADRRKIEVAWYGRRYIQDLHGNPVKRDDLNGLPWTLVNQFASVAHNDFAKVKQLYRDNPGLLNTRASWDEGAVEAGAHMGRLDIAGFLADAGATVSTCTAAVLGQETMVRGALADRRTIRERGAHDLPLLAYTAFATPQVAIAEQLLKAGADVDARGFGQTTLHIAASKGHVELAARLIAYGADVHARAKVRGESLTALDLATRNKQEKMQTFLKERAAGTRSVE